MSSPAQFFALEILRPAVVVALATIYAMWIGRLVVPDRFEGERAGPDGLDPWLLGSLRFVAGYGLASSVLFGLGLFDGFRPLPLVVAFGGLAVLPLRFGARGRGARASEQPSQKGSLGQRFALWAFLALAAAPLAWLCAYPPTAYDAALYHLPFLQDFLATEGLTFSARLRYPVFPQAVEICWVPLALLGGMRTPAWASAATALAVVAGLIGAGRQFATDTSRRTTEAVGARRTGAAVVAGFAAAGLWIGSPWVVRLGTAPMVEMGLSAFAFAAGVAAVVAIDPRTRRPERWALLAGAFGGWAASTKYLGLGLLGLLGATLLLRASGPLRERFRLPAFAALAALVTGGPAYVRLVALTGNPVFPFLSRVFGSSPWNQAQAPGVARLKTAGEAIEASADLPRVMLALFTGGGHFGAPPLDPWFLLLPVPLVLLAWREAAGRRTERSDPSTGRRTERHLGGVDRGVLQVGLAFSVYAALWIVLPRDPRFLLPAVPWAALTLALVLASRTVRASGPLVRRERATVVAWLVGAALALPGLGFAVAVADIYGPVPLTPEAAEAFIDRRLPGHASIRVWRDRGSPGRLYLLGRANLHAFTDRRGFGDHFGLLSHREIAPLLEEPCSLRDFLAHAQIETILVGPVYRRVDLSPCFELLSEEATGDRLWRAKPRSSSAKLSPSPASKK